METIKPTLAPGRNYLATLYRMLDLAQQTAEAASADGNHKVVIQAIREVTRIITLITKIAATSDQAKSCPGPSPKKPKESDKFGNPKLLQSEGRGRDMTPGPSQTTRNRKLPIGVDKQPLAGNWLKALDEGRLDIETLHAIGSGRKLPKLSAL
jgi:hypothetical protein